jgi:hypothetical protein
VDAAHPLSANAEIPNIAPKVITRFFESIDTPLSSLLHR